MNLIDQYKEMHKKGYFRGHSAVFHVKEIGNLITETGAKSLLDYGCGKGEQYTRNNIHTGWGIMPYLYDPAVPGIDQKPLQMFDGVICTDVAEHIPEDEIDTFIKDVLSYARKFVFFSICCHPAKKKLPDGRNCHVTVQNEEWWENRINRVETDLKVVIEWNPT